MNLKEVSFWRGTRAFILFLVHPVKRIHSLPYHIKLKIAAMSIAVTFWGIAFFSPAVRNGLLGDKAWLMFLITLACFHMSMITISIYLHRGETHRAVRFVKPVRHFFRFWLWFFTGINRAHWVSVHRYHHQHTETEKDPHSPSNHGLKIMFTHGIEIYNQAYEDDKVKRYGLITDNDRLEKLYSKRFGVLLLLCVFILLFGLWAIPLWLGLMTAQIISQNFVINGLGHHRGYRNYETPDNSQNVCRLGLLVLGEELHNNHHKNARSPRFSRKKNEFDLGWYYLLLLYKVGLAKIKFERILLPKHAVSFSKDKT